MDGNFHQINQLNHKIPGILWISVRITMCLKGVVEHSLEYHRSDYPNQVIKVEEWKRIEVGCNIERREAHSMKEISRQIKQWIWTTRKDEARIIRLSKNECELCTLIVDALNKKNSTTNCYRWIVKFILKIHAWF